MVLSLPREKIDPGIFKIAGRLREKGFSSYLVGGAVRDIVFGREPKDFDLATDAPCEAVREIFKSVVPYGMKHGTVIVVSGGKPYDVTSFMDGEAPPLNIENDLSLRDFTINAMACDMGSLELIDPHGGVRDFQSGTIRCVGRPEDRFAKDPLRMLRAVRQAAQFGFSIDEGTFAAMKDACATIERSAPERISAELVKAFSAGCGSKYVRYLVESGVWGSVAEKYLGTRSAALARKPAYNNFLIACDSLAGAHYRLKLSLLIVFTFYCDSAERAAPELPDFRKCKKLLRDLKFSGEDFEPMAAFVSLSLGQIAAGGRRDRPANEASVKKDMAAFFAATSQKNVCKDVYALCEAFFKILGMSNEANAYYEGLRMLEEVARDNHPVFIEDLAVDGETLKKVFSLGQSSRIGEMLRYAQDAVIETPSDNRKDVLVKKIAAGFGLAPR